MTRSTKYIPRRQAANKADVCEHTINRAIRAGQLPATKVGHSVLIERRDFAAWLAERLSR